jgi:hypothetical protein
VLTKKNFAVIYKTCSIKVMLLTTKQNKIRNAFLKKSQSEVEQLVSKLMDTHIDILGTT